MGPGMKSRSAPMLQHAKVNRSFIDFTGWSWRLDQSYHKLHKAFSKFYRRHSELVEKYNVGLRKLLQQGILEPEFYGDLVYRIRKIVGKSNFSEQFRKLIYRYKRTGYNPYVMQHTACLVINPTSVDSYASLFNCTTAGRASHSMTALTYNFHKRVGAWCYVFGLAHRGSTGGFL